MRVVAVIQARYSSQRLPGKVLRSLAGKPLLGHIFEALSRCKSVDGIMLATSVDRSDDLVAAFAEQNGIACHRGELREVFSRLRGAAVVSKADAIVRVNGDSPLLDPALVDRAVELFRARPDCDLVSNVDPRSFPKGQSVEVISTRCMQAVKESVTKADDLEHVTPYFYANKERYRIQTFSADVARPDVQLSVDTAEDLDHCGAILQRLRMPAWKAGWVACVEASDVLRRQKAAS